MPPQQQNDDETRNRAGAGPTAAALQTPLATITEPDPAADAQPLASVTADSGIDTPDHLTQDEIEFREGTTAVTDDGADVTAAAPAQTAYRLNRYERQRIANGLSTTRMQDAGRIREIRAARAALNEQRDAHLGTSRPMLPGARQREWDQRRDAIQAPLEELNHEEAAITERHSDIDSAVEQREGLEAQRDQMLDRSVNLLELAVEEKITEQPEWLTTAIGIPPVAAGAERAWHMVASSITTYRLVNDIADSADVDLDSLMPTLAAQRDSVRTNQVDGQTLDRDQSQGLSIGF